MCEQLAQSRYMTVEQLGVNPATSHWQVRCPDNCIVKPSCASAHLFCCLNMNARRSVSCASTPLTSRQCLMCFVLQKSACMAVRNIVSRRRDLVDAFTSRGVESHLRHAMASHQSCRDEAHAALRDLGCQVDLKELWTGSGSQLQQ